MKTKPMAMLLIIPAEWCYKWLCRKICSVKSLSESGDYGMNIGADILSCLLSVRFIDTV